MMPEAVLCDAIRSSIGHYGFVNSSMKAHGVAMLLERV
jgi:hypothetical protein